MGVGVSWVWVWFFSVPGCYCRVIVQEEIAVNWSSRLVDIKKHFNHLKELLVKTRGKGQLGTAAIFLCNDLLCFTLPPSLLLQRSKFPWRPKGTS